MSIRISARRAFTSIELLVAMALIIFLMSVLSVAFESGLESFRRLKAGGDLNEPMREYAANLRRDIEETHVRTEDFLRDSLRAGAFDPKIAAELRVDYAGIHADAANLEDRLRALERDIVNPAAKRVLRRTLESLVGLKEAAGDMMMLLSLILGDD